MTERRTPTGRTQRRSWARSRVLDAIAAARRPLSAEDIATLVPDVHVSSVYRALAALEAEGTIGHLHLGHGPSIYRLTSEMTSDGHLVCEKCGYHDTVPQDRFAALAADLLAEHAFVLDTSHFAVVGLCRACAQQPTSS